LYCACLVAVVAAFAVAMFAEFLNVSVKGFDAGLEVGSMVLASASAYADEFFRFQAVFVTFSYGLRFEFVVVDFLDLEYFTPISCLHLDTLRIYIVYSYT